jgi:phosphoribosylanthranilate isomerase
MRTRIKICCISSPEEAAVAIAAGADALGLVGEMPTGPGIISDALAREIADAVPAPVSAWLLTAESDAAAILAHAVRCGVTTVQIVRHVDPIVHEGLAAGAPWLRRVQVIHVEGSAAVDLVTRYGSRPHAFLLDSGRPSAAELGGTGRTHDWAVSRRCVEAAARPVFLAGGLGPANAAEAIAAVRPFGLDICSGLRRDGRLDPALVAAFVAAVRDADAIAAAQPRTRVGKPSYSAE